MMLASSPDPLVSELSGCPPPIWVRILGNGTGNHYPHGYRVGSGTGMGIIP